MHIDDVAFTDTVWCKDTVSIRYRMMKRIDLWSGSDSACVLALSELGC